MTANNPLEADLKEVKRAGRREFKDFPCVIYQTRELYQQGRIVEHHWHDEVEIIHFLGGTFTLEINMQQYTVDRECLYFINSGELHSISCNSSLPTGDDAILFHPGILSFESCDAAQMQLIHPLMQKQLLFPRRIMTDDPVFAPLMDAFTDVLLAFGATKGDEIQFEHGAFSDDQTNQLYIKSALLRILALLSTYHLFVPADKSYNKKVEGIKSVLTYIQNHYRDKLYISDLAAQINLNELYFCRYFKKAIGCSPTEYINEYRIRQARHLLVDTDLSVMDVSLDCGYNNLGNFYREFRQYTSMTPLEYKKSQNIGV